MHCSNFTLKPLKCISMCASNGCEFVLVCILNYSLRSAASTIPCLRWQTSFTHLKNVLCKSVLVTFSWQKSKNIGTEGNKNMGQRAIQPVVLWGALKSMPILVKATVSKTMRESRYYKWRGSLLVKQKKKKNSKQHFFSKVLLAYQQFSPSLPSRMPWKIALISYYRSKFTDRFIWVQEGRLCPIISAVKSPSEPHWPEGTNERIFFSNGLKYPETASFVVQQLSDRKEGEFWTKR